VEEVNEEMGENPEELLQVPAKKQRPSIAIGLGTGSHEKPSQEEASVTENPNPNTKNVTSMDALQMSHNQLVDYATTRHERLLNEALAQNPQLFEESDSSSINPTTSNLSPQTISQSKPVSAEDNTLTPPFNPAPVNPIPQTDTPTHTDTNTPYHYPTLASPANDTNTLLEKTNSPIGNINTPIGGGNGSFLGQPAKSDFLDPFADCERQMAMDTGDSVNVGFLGGGDGKSEMKIDGDPFKSWGEEGGRLEGLGGEVFGEDLNFGEKGEEGVDLWGQEGDGGDKLF
jgi:hypothetical protein